MDHIPHNEEGKPVAYLEGTYTPYSVSVNVPDIKCDKCSLQLLYVMTDKTVSCGSPTCYYNPADAACKGSTDPSADTCLGAPNDNVCVAENECFSNCKWSNVFLMKSVHVSLYLCTMMSDHSCSDVAITGTQPLSAFSMDSQPADWPFKSMQMQYYGAEVGAWKGGWLENVPSNYTTDFGTLKC